MLVKIVESLLSSMIVLMLQKSTTRERGILSVYRWFIASAFLSLPKGGLVYHLVVLAHHRVHQQTGVLYQDGIVKRLLRCGAEKDMPMQQGLKDLAVQSANQGRTCFFLSLALHNIYEYLSGKHQLNIYLGVKPDVLCVLCTLWARLSVYHHSMVFLTEVTLAEEISSFYGHSTGK